MSIPKDQRWHESNRTVNTARLDTTSMNMLQISLNKLKEPWDEKNHFAAPDKPIKRLTTFAR